MSREDAPDVSLADQHTRVVDRLREAGLEDLGLETALQEILDLERQHVIETHTRLVEHTDADEPADERVTLEKTLGVLRVELEQLTSGTTNLRQDETDTPDLALVAQTVLAGELHESLAERYTCHDFCSPSAPHRDVRSRRGDGGPCSCYHSYDNGAGLSISTLHPST